MASAKVTAAAKTKAPKTAKAVPSHPPYIEMAKEAIAALKERNGSSLYAIAKLMEEKQGKHLPANFKKVLSVQLKKFVAGGKLVKVKNSFKLPPASSAAKKAAPAAAKKPAPAAAKKGTKRKAGPAVKAKPAKAAKTEAAGKAKPKKTAAAAAAPAKKKKAPAKAAAKKPKSLKSPSKKARTVVPKK